MIKINLLDIPEGQAAPERKKVNHSVETTRTEPDLTLLEQNDRTADIMGGMPEEMQDEETLPFFPVEESSQKVEEEEPVSKPVPEADGESYEDVYSDSKSNRLKIWGMVLGGVLVVLAFFAVRPLFTSCDESSGPLVNKNATTAQPQQNNETTAQPGESSAAATTLPEFLQSKYKQNAGENTYRLNLLNSILSARSGKTEPNLVVVTTGYAFVSVAGNSRDDFSKFRKALQSANPEVKVSLESVENKVINGRDKLVADFSMTTKKLGAGATNLPQSILNDANFQNVLRSLIKKHGLNVTYLKTGDKIKSGRFKQSYYYAKIRGNQSSIINFLNELARNYPAIKFSKISLFSGNTKTLNGKNVNANIELIFFMPS